MKYAAVEEALHGGDAARAVPELCWRALSDIAEGRWELTAVRHPLGFVCLPVQREGEYGVCVHLWTPAPARLPASTSAVHSHSWDLVSFVLYGHVGNTLLRVVDDPVAGTHRIFEVHSRGDVDEVMATPRLVRCIEEEHRTTGPSAMYRLRAGRFHASVLEGGAEAATVVLGRTRPAAVDMSLGPPDTPNHRLPRQRCGVEETSRFAGIAVQKLATVMGTPNTDVKGQVGR